MKLRKLILFAAALLLCAVPITAHANSAAPDPNDHELMIDDIREMQTLIVYGHLEDGSYEVWMEFSSFDDESMTRTRIAKERIIDLYNTGGRYTGFSLEISFFDGAKASSEVVSFVENGSYIYDVENNSVESTGVFQTKRPGGLMIALWAFMFIIPWGLTVLLEWLTALIFKIRPSRYVCFTNLVSNPVMNIVLLIVMSLFMVNYFVVVLVLEVLVIVFEYLFYLHRYKDTGRVRLLLFTITANAVSFGTYAIISGLF